MATGVQIADIYNPLVWNRAIQEKAIEYNRFIECGMCVDNAELKALASGPSTIGELPFFKGLTNDEPNYSSDDSAIISVPAKITSGKQIYRKSFANKSWATMDLAVEIGAVDPVEAIVNRIGKYWATNSQNRCINALRGVMAGNILNNASDMVMDVATLETGAAPAASKVINANLVIDAGLTMGDHAPDLACICMHSVVFGNLQKLNLITYVPTSTQDIKWPSYLGYRVVVDDQLTPRAGGVSGFVYTTILCGMDVCGYGLGTPPVPSEIYRLPNAGNGGGQDLIFSRNTEICHPFGFAFTSASVAATTATYAELALAANWTRVYAQRKNVALAFIRTNG